MVKNTGERTDIDDGYEHTIKLNGVMGFVSSISRDGKKVTISGWDNKHWGFKVGQRVLVITSDGRKTRYLFDSINHCGDPNDQYFAECSFFPRS